MSKPGTSKSRCDSGHEEITFENDGLGARCPACEWRYRALSAERERDEVVLELASVARILSNRLAGKSF